MKKLWYKNESKLWNEALPIGNGRIGAMVFSGAISDKLQINEDTLWSGYPKDWNNRHSLSELNEVRQLIKNKNFFDATEMLSDTMTGVRSQGYVSYGNLCIDIICEKSSVEAYKRELDLKTGIVRSGYSLNGVNVEKEVFTSLKDDLMIINIKSDNYLKFHIYESVNLEHSIKTVDNSLVSCGRCPTNVFSQGNIIEYEEDKESVQFMSLVSAITESMVYGGGNSLWVAPTKELTIFFSIKTSFNGYNKLPISEGREYKNACTNVIENAKKYTYDVLKERHITEYKKYFDRVELHIDGEDFSDLPTDVRIENMGNGTVDNELVTLLFDYGRYLTIASSMEGTQPSNLQGIWNYHLIAPWHSNYTMNINTQMNYWLTETVNLPECHMPYLKMLKEFSKKGNNFGLRGWCAWHNSDIWRFNNEATKSAQCGFWIMGGFWGVRHIWEHYLHTKDNDFLKEYYPIMVGACEFLEDFMIENEKGELITCPSTSPENQFIYNGKTCAVAQGSAMDMGIIYDLFDKTEKASEILELDQTHFTEIKNNLAPIKIGSDGRISEWSEEFQEAEPGHRHISHLYGFYPSDILTSKEYEDAVKKSLETRLANGGGHTGWSNAWIANIYARLKDGEKVMEHIRNMFKKSIYPNMFDAHPPFQIDGNFGIAAAICEALMQSHKGEVELLPALPKEWKSGYVKGIKTKTGETINFKWSDFVAEKF